jgi:hypothetical protein
MPRGCRHSRLSSGPMSLQRLYSHKTIRSMPTPPAREARRHHAWRPAGLSEARRGKVLARCGPAARGLRVCSSASRASRSTATSCPALDIAVKNKHALTRTRYRICKFSCLAPPAREARRHHAWQPQSAPAPGWLVAARWPATIRSDVFKEPALRRTGPVGPRRQEVSMQGRCPGLSAHTPLTRLDRWPCPGLPCGPTRTGGPAQGCPSGLLGPVARPRVALRAY